MLSADTHAAPKDCVLIHGAGGNSALWSGVMAELSGDGSAYSLNLPGHPTGDIVCRSAEQYADSVHQFIQDANLTRPVVCGHSMGGAVALTLALKHPEDPSGLVLVGTGAKLGVLPEIVSGLEREPLKVIEKTITPLSFYRTDLETARRARPALSMSNPEVFLNDYLVCKEFDVRSRLGEIGAKTLVLCGERDRMTPPKWSHYLNANIADSASWFIREAGHMVPIENPHLCAKLLTDFLLSLSR